MSKYYTNVAVQGNNILFRGVKNGRRVKMKIQYSPTLFLPSKKTSEWKTLFNENLEPMKFGDIRDARDFVRKYDGVENFKIYGNDRFEYAFIADEFVGQIDWDLQDIHVAIIDIEVGSENGFPDPYKATEPITAIAIKKLGGDVTVYGCGDYETKGEEVYVKCDLETCEQRDPKGLYKKARAGEIKHFTGISDPFEVPANADVVVDSGSLDVNECVVTIASELSSLLKQ